MSALMMQLFVYLLLAAVLGFALGWLIRGGSAGASAAGAEESGRDGERLEAGERERERLARELSASERARRDLQGELDGMRAEATELDVAHRRIAELEGEVAVARRAEEDDGLRAPRPEADGAPAPGAAMGATQPGGAVDGHAEAGAPPEQLTAPQGRPDDLKQISGIGPSIEKMLNGLGIYHFRQIAAFTPANVAWVDQHLRFKGRIARENWIGQARTLAVEDVRART